MFHDTNIGQNYRWFLKIVRGFTWGLKRIWAANLYPRAAQGALVTFSGQLRAPLGPGKFLWRFYQKSEGTKDQTAKIKIQRAPTAKFPRPAIGISITN